MRENLLSETDDLAIGYWWIDEFLVDHLEINLEHFEPGACRKHLELKIDGVQPMAAGKEARGDPGEHFRMEN